MELSGMKNESVMKQRTAQNRTACSLAYVKRPSSSSSSSSSSLLNSWGKSPPEP